MFHKRLISELGENRKYIVGMVFSQWVALIANLILTAITVGYLVAVATNENRNMVGYLMVFVIVVTVRGVMMTVESRMSYQVATLTKKGIRDKIYQKLMSLGSEYRTYISTAEVVQLSTEGVEQLEIYFGKYIAQFFYSLLAPLTLFGVVATIDIKVAFVLLICVPLIPGAIMGVQKFAKKMLHKYWGTYTELGGTFLEGLQGLTTLKVYQADESYAGKMDDEAENFRKMTMRVLIMQLNSISIMDIIAYGGAAAGIVLSILAYRSGDINFAQGLFIILISAEFFLPMRRLGSFFHIAMNGNAAADKIFKLLDTPEAHWEEIEKKSIDEEEIIFSNVCFGYEEEQAVLEQISFAIKRNSFTAIAGVSGCGKSTIAALMMGEQRAYQGEIWIQGQESKALVPNIRYQRITRVGHESYLFKGTVADNLKMGNETATQNQMIAAMRQVDLYETILEKGGLLMEVAEQGSNLSGGQRQRLALARAILHASDIYIFDEATSNIDIDSENKIMTAILQLAKAKTIVLISHRLANIKKADKILFLEQGQLREKGTHEELLQQGGAYQKLYKEQWDLEQYGRTGNI